MEVSRIDPTALVLYKLIRIWTNQTRKKIALWSLAHSWLASPNYDTRVTDTRVVRMQDRHK